jgi:hypothetical protein
MNITTRFNVDDSVFFMQNNVIAHGIVRIINVVASSNTLNSNINIDIQYRLDGFQTPISESLLFNSARDVVDTLLSS